jgi:chloramphenicol 3-O-phosphotransferase
VDENPRAVLVVGAQASGKSSIARSLATRCGRGAFIEGDVLWKMVVGGAESFVSEGFVAVHAENMYGEVAETPRIGSWIDSSDRTIDATLPSGARPLGRRQGRLTSWLT